jgi:cytochrome P450
MSFEFDPFDPQYWDNPYPWYTEMRHNHPVYRHDTAMKRVWPHYWMISRAKDVNDALFDWKSFSSASGTLIDTDASLLP